MKHQIVGILSFLFVACSPLAVQAGLILSVDYEDGTFGNVSKTSTGKYPSLCCTHSAQLVTSPVRGGGKAVKMTLLPTDEGYEYSTYKKPYVRAEFEKWGIAHVGDQRWYGFSVYVDPSYIDTSTSPDGPGVIQWHTNNDSCDIAKSPHLAISIKPSTMTWGIFHIFDSNPCTTSSSFTRLRWDIGPVVKGVWVDWIIYAKWSYGSDGVLKVWKDGKLVIERYGPNTYNDQNPEFLKWGLYQPWWNVKPAAATDKVVVYIDELKIGDASSSFNEVATKTFKSAPAGPTNLQITIQ